MNTWEQLFEGPLADEFGSMLTADFDESLRLADQGKENTGHTCNHTCSCSPQAACGDAAEKSNGCDPAKGSVHNTDCHTCSCGPNVCAPTKKTAHGEFLPRVPGWSMPPAPHASL